MPIPTTHQPRKSRPMGQHRFPVVELGNSLRFRILSPCMDDAGNIAMPAYPVHRVTQPAADGSGDRYDDIACINDNANGECAGVYLPDGTSLHSKDRSRTTAAIVVWIYDLQQIRILDLNEGMYSAIAADCKSPYWGDPRTFDYELRVEAGRSKRFPKIRKLQAIPQKEPLPPQVQQFVAANWQEYWSNVWPVLNPADVAQYFGGSTTPAAGATAAPAAVPPQPQPAAPGAFPPVAAAPAPGGPAAMGPAPAAPTFAPPAVPAAQPAAQPGAVPAAPSPFPTAAPTPGTIAQPPEPPMPGAAAQGPGHIAWPPQPAAGAPAAAPAAVPPATPPAPWADQ